MLGAVWCCWFVVVFPILRYVDVGFWCCSSVWLCVVVWVSVWCWFSVSARLVFVVVCVMVLVFCLCLSIVLSAIDVFVGF